MELPAISQASSKDPSTSPARLKCGASNTTLVLSLFGRLGWSVHPGSTRATCAPVRRTRPTRPNQTGVRVSPFFQPGSATASNETLLNTKQHPDIGRTAPWSALLVLRQLLVSTCEFLQRSMMRIASDAW